MFTVRNDKDLERVPEGTESIMCYGASINSFFKLPKIKSLKSVTCDNSGIGSLKYLPDSVTTISCSGCTYLVEVEDLPSSLENLICNECGILEAVKLPNNLQNASFDGCRMLHDLGVLPKNLEELRVPNTAVISLLGIQETNLRVLDISSTNINSLSELFKSGLEVLIASDLYLSNDDCLALIPSSLTCLDLTDTYVEDEEFSIPLKFFFVKDLTMNQEMLDANNVFRYKLQYEQMGKKSFGRLRDL